MDDHTCQTCNARPARPDTFACAWCVNEWRTNLYTIVSLRVGLDDKRAGLTAIRTDGPGYVTGDKDARLPFDQRVGPVEEATRRAVLTPGRVLGLVTSPVEALTPAAERVITTTAISLIGSAHEYASHSDAPAWIDAATDAAKRITDLFEPRPAMLYLGYCSTVTDEQPDGCIQAMYVPANHHGNPTAMTVVCPRCKTQHDVTERRTVLLQACANYTATVRELVRLIPSLSQPTFSRLANSGMVEQAGERMEVNTRGELRNVSTYRVGDVRDALDFAERAKRRRAAERVALAERQRAGKVEA